MTGRESLDEPHLPEGMIAVESDARDHRDHLGQLARSAGRRYRGSPDVIVDVDVVVADIDPVGMRDIERHSHESPPEGLEQWERLAHLLS